MKVKNMISSKGNKIANQFIIECVKIPCPSKFIDDMVGFDGDLFQSYDSIIAFRPYTWDIEERGAYKVYLDQKYWDYSTTTSKYRNQFLRETKKETQKKIDTGEYILTNLN